MLGKRNISFFKIFLWNCLHDFSALLQKPKLVGEYAEAKVRVMEDVEVLQDRLSTVREFKKKIGDSWKVFKTYLEKASIHWRKGRKISKIGLRCGIER